MINVPPLKQHKYHLIIQTCEFAHGNVQEKKTEITFQSQAAEENLGRNREPGENMGEQRETWQNRRKQGETGQQREKQKEIYKKD